MTKLQRILLAGTIIPTLVLAPAVSSAQTPDQGGDRHPRRERAEGGGQKGEGGARRDRQADQAGGERRKGADGASGAASAGRNAGSDEGRGAHGRRNADGRNGDAKAGEAERGDKRDARDDDRGGRRKRDRDAANPDSSGASQGASGQDQGNGRAGRRDAGDAGDAKTAGDREDRGRKGRRDRDADDTTKGNARDAGDRDDTTRRGRDRDDGTRTGGRDTAPGDRDNGRADRDAGNGRRDDDQRRGQRLGDDNGRNDRDRNDRDRGDRDRGDRRVGAGFAGGFIGRTDARRLDEIRRDRREVREGDTVYIREPGRTIVRENGRAFIVHDEGDRYRALGYDVRRERSGVGYVETIRRPGGEVILSYTDGSGRLLRRVRRGVDGREVVIIDNGVGGRVGSYREDIIVLPPPPIRIPRERYVVDYRDANAGLIYETLIAPPLAAPPQRYTLDQIRYSPDVRSYVRSVDINTINFDTGSWDVPQEAAGKLQALATAINRAIERNPNAVFLVEGYTDAVGNPDDNLSLSDRRAQSVAEILTKSFNVPPENLTTQGYGQQNPKEQTDGPSAANRRVVVQNITQLLASGSPATGQ